MPTDFDYNQFRRYIGDFDKESVDEDTIDSYLDDATAEATAVHVTPDVPIITSYDALSARYSPEVILLAAINWWWNRASFYADQLSTTVGQAAQGASDRWQHALQMVQTLEEKYNEISSLGHEPDMGNLSHWNRNTLSRVGGQREEDAAAKIQPGITYD